MAGESKFEFGGSETSVGHKEYGFSQEKVTLSFCLYQLFTSSIQLCFVSFRGPLPYPNWLSSRWSMPCQRHGKRVGWNLSHCWAIAYPGELWVFLLAKSHPEKFQSLHPRFPCGPAMYPTVALFLWCNQGRGQIHFFPFVHGRPAAELVTNSETWQVDFGRTSLKNLDWRKNHLVINPKRLSFFLLFYIREYANLSQFLWVKNSSPPKIPFIHFGLDFLSF